MISFKVNSTGNISSTMMTVLAILVIWELLWKGLALWRAAKQDSKRWFILILIINSVGILPIMYLLINKGDKRNTQ